jgi:leucyl-tRNA synthetase
VQDGVFTGAHALHPATGERVPVWVADYVLAHYGTGVVMGVPGHDERDFAFARRYELPVKIVIRPEGADSDLDADSLGAAWTGSGTMVHSGMFDGTPSEKGKVKVATWLRNNGLGGPEVTFRLHDWLISRQRYWGTPIPMIRCGSCGDVPVPEEQLPVLLPEGIQDYRPKGRSPLADVPEFLNTTCPRCGAAAERDADTMDTFIDSSWYHLRYPDPHNATAAFRSEEVARWLPIDLYIGGPEHATGHLLYFRFITMVLHDEGLVPVEEPALRLFNHGMVLDGEGKKMSKSKGNLVAPGDMLARYGVDASRVAMCFFAPSSDPIVWKEEGVQGASRFLRRVYEFVRRNADRVRAASSSQSVDGNVAAGIRAARRSCHEALRNMSRAVETDLAFNTVVSDLMKALAALEAVPAAVDGDVAGEAAFADAVRVFVKVLAPMAPHLGEELNDMLGGTGSVFRGPWPQFDPRALVQDTIEIPVQINGKVRSRIVVPAGTTSADQERAALESEDVRPYLVGVSVRKVIVVPGKIVNIVVG